MNSSSYFNLLEMFRSALLLIILRPVVGPKVVESIRADNPSHQSVSCSIISLEPTQFSQLLCFKLFLLHIVKAGL